MRESLESTFCSTSKYQLCMEQVNTGGMNFVSREAEVIAVDLSACSGLALCCDTTLGMCTACSS